MTTTSKAERIYDAYVAELGDEVKAPKFADLPDRQSRAWFAVYNALDSILENVETKEPYDFELRVPIPPRRIGDSFVTTDGQRPPNADEVIPETLPTSLKIRPMMAADLCLPEYRGGQAEYNVAIRARVMEIDMAMLEERVDLADYEEAKWLLQEANGHDAPVEMRVVFEEAGGERLVEDDMHGWRAAAIELLTDEVDNYYLVRTRTPGLGTIKIGPLRVKHTRIYEDVATEQTEWDGRITALAAASGKSVESLKAARIEDVDTLWTCFAMLKKKSETQALLRFGSRLSSRSTGGPGKTSSPSTSTGST